MKVKVPSHVARRTSLGDIAKFNDELYVVNGMYSSHNGCFLKLDARRVEDLSLNKSYVEIQ